MNFSYFAAYLVWEFGPSCKSVTVIVLFSLLLDEYDILEPTYHFQKEEIEQCQKRFQTFRRRRQKLLKQHVVNTYKTIPVKHIERYYA